MPASRETEDRWPGRGLRRERGPAEAFGGGSPEVSGEGASGESENFGPRRGGLGRTGESVLLLRPRRGGLGRQGLGEGASGESEIFG